MNKCLNNPSSLGLEGQKIIQQAQPMNSCIVFVFSHQEFLANEKMPKGLLTYQTDLSTSIYKCWFITSSCSRIVKK